MSGARFTAADDRFHFDAMSDRWWETETCWFSFSHPERRLGGWLYTMVRPNIGTVAGGAWIWDDSAWLPWEALYSTNYTALRLPAGQDLDDIELPSGIKIRAVEPLTSYELGYHDPGRLQLDLRFDAVMAPHGLTGTGSSFGLAHHFDQFGRVSGQIVLHGERLAIDCLAMRDRSWGPRPEHRPRETAYVTGIADPGCGFLALTNPAEDGGTISHGFFLDSGRVAAWAEGHRLVERDPMAGWVNKVTIEGRDVEGRELLAVGTPVSRIVLNRHTAIDSNSLLRWELNGRPAWGEDQDLWPVHTWAADRRRDRREQRAPTIDPALTGAGH